jgi:hypothetical protein
MTLAAALSNAARRVGLYKGLWALIWLAMTALALVVAIPAIRALGPLSKLPEAGPKYAPRLDPAYAVEWAVHIMPGASGVLIGTILAFSVLTLLAHRLLHRGLVLEGAGLYFWRYLRLALISLIFYAIAASIGSGILKAVKRAWGEGMEARPMMVGEWAVQLLMFVLLGLVATIFDYAKVRLAVDGSRKTWRAAFGSARLVFNNLFTTMGAWASVTLLGFLFFLLWRTVENAVASRSLAAVLLLLLVQQAYVVSRVWIRLMFWGVAIELDSALRAPAPAVEPEPLPPPSEEPAPPVIEPDPEPEAEPSRD